MMTNAYIPSYCRASLNSRRPNRWSEALALVVSLTPAICMALPDDADKPIHIQSDTSEYDMQDNVAVYRGSVRVDQGTLRVTADEMTVEWEQQNDERKVVRIIATGKPAHYHQQIDVDQSVVNADASTIIYNTQEERIDLVGEDNLEQEGNTITGDRIVYDIVAGKVDATAEGDGRVRMELQPAAKDN